MKILVKEKGKVDAVGCCFAIRYFPIQCQRKKEKKIGMEK